LSLTKATVHRLLNTMERFDLIERNAESERYRLGLKLHQLGNRAVESRTLRTEAHRLLLEMSRRSRDTVSLAVPAPGGVICLGRINSSHTIIAVCTPVGALFLAHCTAAGKAILAYMPDEDVLEILRAVQVQHRFPERAHRPFGPVSQVFLAHTHSVCELPVEEHSPVRFRLSVHHSGPLARRF
jgi:DNA-binding IclR family transcriptional regulator